MNEIALAALYRAVTQRLQNSGDMWGSRVYAERAPAKVVRPYVIFQWQGGGDINRLMATKDAEIVLVVKAVAETMANAFVASARLGVLLDDMGLLDKLATPTDALNGGAYWNILTTTQEAIIHISEMVDGVDIYHEGFTLRVKMEAKSS